MLPRGPLIGTSVATIAILISLYPSAAHNQKPELVLETGHALSRMPVHNSQAGTMKREVRSKFCRDQSHGGGAGSGVAGERRRLMPKVHLLSMLNIEHCPNARCPTYPGESLHAAAFRSQSAVVTGSKRTQPPIR